MARHNQLNPPADSHYTMAGLEVKVAATGPQTAWADAG
jgi:hypothetical protein